ncbi:MAG: V-type proton ATPase subunit E [Desulfurococcaceae archaeon]|jgi:vacuolar-type H+-ATPase subunit E/Vma4|nr:V-type proton ATPase subunit E [Desulfurococcaceae archaeon]
MSEARAIREAVIRKALEEAEAIIRKAEEESRKMIKEAEERKRAIVEEERRKALAELGYEARIAEAKLSARLIISKAKSELLNSIISKATDILRSLPPNLKLESLRKLLEESLDNALVSLGTVRKLIIYVAEQDMELAKNLVINASRERGIELELRSAKIFGGVVVEEPESGVVIDNSFDSRLFRLVSRLKRGLLREVLL